MMILIVTNEKILYILYINKKKEEENISRYMYSKKNNKDKNISGLNDFLIKLYVYIRLFLNIVLIFLLF